MAMPRVLTEIDEDTEVRKKAKKAFDEIYTLHKQDKKEKDVIKFAVNRIMQGEQVRLLDEGMVVDGGGIARMYLMKGSLKEYYDQLSEDYVGTINYAHAHFTYDPIILGLWGKKDLTLGQKDDGRYYLDVNLNLDKGLHRVQDLYRNAETIEGYKIGVSAEFTTRINEQESNKMCVPAVESLNILDYAIVGDAGNVLSGGITLGKEKEKEVETLAGTKAKRKNIVIAALEKLGWSQQDPDEETEVEEVESEVEKEADSDEEVETDVEKDVVSDAEVETDVETEEAGEEVQQDTEEAEETLEELLNVIKEEADKLSIENEKLQKRIEELESEKETLAKEIGTLKLTELSNLRTVRDSVRNIGARRLEELGKSMPSTNTQPTDTNEIRPDRI